MYYLMVLVLLFLAELFYFRVADRYNIIDKPNERSSHTKVTLRGGGIIFYFGALAYFLTSGFEYPWFLLALTLVTFISFVDDIKSTGQMTRLLFHFSAMAMMFYQWGLFSLSPMPKRALTHFLIWQNFEISCLLQLPEARHG